MLIKLQHACEPVPSCQAEHVKSFSCLQIVANDIEKTRIMKCKYLCSQRRAMT